MKRFLDRLLGRGNAPGECRRRPGHGAPGNRALLLWRDGAETRGCRARLLDLRGAGATVAAERRLTRGQAVWLRVEAPAPTRWIGATVARRVGARRVALDFADDGPHDELKSAVQGLMPA